MTKKEYEVQEALGLAGHFLLELVIGLPCSRKEVEKAVAKYTYDSKLLRWKVNDIDQRDSLLYGVWATTSYVFDIKCPFEIMLKIRAELKDCYVNSQMAMWNTAQWTTFQIS